MRLFSFPAYVHMWKVAPRRRGSSIGHRWPCRFAVALDTFTRTRMSAAQKSKFIFLGVLEELRNHSKNRVVRKLRKVEGATPPVLSQFLKKTFSAAMFS